VDPDQDLKSQTKPGDNRPPPFPPTYRSNSAFETLTFSPILDCESVVYKCQEQIIIIPVQVVGSRCATAKLSAALASHLPGPLVTKVLEMTFHLPETFYWIRI
jgi:hypothetical protein